VKTIILVRTVLRAELGNRHPLQNTAILLNEEQMRSFLQEWEMGVQTPAGCFPNDIRMYFSSL